MSWVDKPKSQKKTQSEWTETVMRMKNKNGAPVNDEEAKTIIDYLAEELREVETAISDELRGMAHSSQQAISTIS